MELKKIDSLGSLRAFGAVPVLSLLKVLAESEFMEVELDVSEQMSLIRMAYEKAKSLDECLDRLDQYYTLEKNSASK